MTIRITDDTSRAEVEQAIANVLASIRRLPGVETHTARGHERINALLDDWCVLAMREELAVDEVPD